MHNSSGKRWALITGASGGIGEALAYVLAREGYSLILSARSTEALEMVASKCQQMYGTEVQCIPADLSLPDAATELWRKVVGNDISVHILINNAGFGDYGSFSASDPDKNQRMIVLNVQALTELSRLALPDMLATKSGYIMNVASVAAFQPGPYMAVYYATKAYVLSFSEAIAEECKGSGVTVTALCPGPTSTGFVEKASAGENPVFRFMKMPTATEVAEYGYRAMMRGKRVAVHGFGNRLLAMISPRMPRGLVVRAVRMMQERR